jgi:hypothetical protein
MSGQKRFVTRFTQNLLVGRKSCLGSIGRFPAKRQRKRQSSLGVKSTVFEVFDQRLVERLHERFASTRPTERVTSYVYILVEFSVGLQHTTKGNNMRAY